MVTRIRFVVKIGRFLPQNGDENRPRRQKRGGPCKKDDEIRPRRQK
ncbi:hypothetical protein [Caldibacillus sp. 210928-DFI.2.22]|nr:hypothetical protein [Caldibacillus sp. 210928-DFI.2.22]